MKFLLEMKDYPEDVQVGIIQYTKNKDVLIFYSKSINSRKRAAVASNPATPTEVLDNLVFDKIHTVVIALVSNPNLLEVSLDRLADITKEEKILIEIAKHPNTSLQRLQLLAKSEKLKVKQAAEKRLITERVA